MKQSKLSTIDDWLAHVGSVHNHALPAGLDRMREMTQRLGINPNSPVIIVGGTNGKGSTVSGLEAIYCAAGYRTGAFTSPFLFNYPEQIRLNGQEATEAEICEAFTVVDIARTDLRLTAFEFHTLMALFLFQKSELDIWILEVGLGGRLDPVNVIDADLAIITSISLDHTEYLGNTREDIGFEKAGIFRDGKKAIYGEYAIPNSINQVAEAIGTTLFLHGEAFGYQDEGEAWRWFSNDIEYIDLPKPALYLQNMANVLMAIHLLGSVLPVSAEQILKGLSQVSLPGRIEVRSGPVTEIFDVAHNPGSIALLAERLKQMQISGRILAVFSMLRDKDIGASLVSMDELVDEWFIAPLAHPRGIAREIMAKVLGCYRGKVNCFDSVLTSLLSARNEVWVGDVIVVFGSFRTVAEAKVSKHN